MQATKNVLRMSEEKRKERLSTDASCVSSTLPSTLTPPPPHPPRTCLFVCLFVHVDVYSQGKICVHRASKENGREASPKVG